MMRKRALGLPGTLLFCAFQLYSSGAWAADPIKPPVAAAPPAATNAPRAVSPAPTTGGAQRVDVDALKQKYWAKGNDRELEVVQNRIYTKAHKVNLELNYGNFSADPFLNTSAIGGLLGFYFNEYLGVDLVYFKLSSSHSSAYDAFVNKTGNGSNSNPLTSLIGGEITASLLYGKLSLLGKAILHFDLMARAGVGKLALSGDLPAQTQSPLAPWIGFGQQLYVTRWMTLHLDWRMLFYSQNVVEQFQPDTKGNVTSTNSVMASMITGGVSFLLF